MGSALDTKRGREEYDEFETLDTTSITKDKRLWKEKSKMYKNSQGDVCSTMTTFLGKQSLCS